MIYIVLQFLSKGKKENYLNIFIIKINEVTILLSQIKWSYI